MRLVLLIALLSACKAGNEETDTGDPIVDDTNDTDTNTETDEPNPGPLGFIGSPCETVADCNSPDLADPVCLPNDDGFPGGTCSQVCDLYCPDSSGHPTTFCVTEAELPAPARLGDGMCLSRCDMGEWPASGCRDGYGCAVVERANESWTEMYACLPDRESDLEQCHFDLAARGVPFEPIIIADSSPDSHPGLTCHVENPVKLKPPIHGVDLVYYNDSDTHNARAACNMAHSLVDTMDDAAAQGAVTMRHLGTVNCRVISGTNSLSRHAFGDAIDIYGFDLAGGQTYTLIDDWEHNTTNPMSPGASWLYESAYRWYDEEYWNIILTPNYNAAHDNHFHVDLTPGSDYIGGGDWRYIGPAPYAD